MKQFGSCSPISFTDDTNDRVTTMSNKHSHYLTASLLLIKKKNKAHARERLSHEWGDYEA